MLDPLDLCPPPLPDAADASDRSATATACSLALPHHDQTPICAPLQPPILHSPIDHIRGASSMASTSLDVAEQPPLRHPDPVVSSSLAAPDSLADSGSPVKNRFSLRLPSFDALGIASLSPLDRLDSTPSDSSITTMAEDSACHSKPCQGIDTTGDAAPILSTHPAAFLAGTSLQAVQHYVATLTPPVEHPELVWDPRNSSLPVDTPHAGTDDRVASFSSGKGDSSSVIDNATFDSSDVTGSHHTTESANISDNPRAWINGATDSVRDLPTPLRVLSHALPSPSMTGHIYSDIVGGIHNKTPTSPTVWINVFHAIPGRFNIADLPTSPPATPGPAIGGDDYFTQKVFDSAVPISDYQEDLSSLPRSPRPVVPPASISLSVVERYIPPSTTHEFSDMFNSSGPSILVDRLVELSPDNGSLIFVYPTRQGAQTFMQDYLGPVLDPLLRSICVVNGLSSDMGSAIGKMAAVDKLLDHNELDQRLRDLCVNLPQHKATKVHSRGHMSHFEVVYSAKTNVKLSRDAWAQDWWTKQEKPRVREIVTKYAQQAQRRSHFSDHLERTPTPTEIVKQLLDGVTKRPYPPGQEPTEGVEVGVFVVRRTA